MAYKVYKKNKYYEIHLDHSKNRIKIKPIGFWPSINTVPKYLTRIFQAIDKELKQDFMLLLDLREMLTHPRDVQEKIHLRAIEGVTIRKPKAVIAVQPEDTISNMQANFLTKKAGVSVKPFYSLETAEEFLDSYAEKHGLL